MVVKPHQPGTGGQIYASTSVGREDVPFTRMEVTRLSHPGRVEGSCVRPRHLSSANVLFQTHTEKRFDLSLISLIPSLM